MAQGTGIGDRRLSDIIHFGAFGNGGDHVQSASITVLVFLLLASGGLAASVSDKTSDCLSCHTAVSPGIVADWEKSLHAKVAPDDALKKPDLERRVSADRIPGELMEVVVGCAECHTMSAEKQTTPLSTATSPSTLL